MKKTNFYPMIAFACLVLTFGGCAEDDDPIPGECLSPAASYFEMDGSPATAGSTTVVGDDNNAFADIRYSTFPGLINANLLALSQVQIQFSFYSGTVFSTTEIDMLDSIPVGTCRRLTLRVHSQVVPGVLCAFADLNTREERPTSTGTSTDNYNGNIQGDIFVSNVDGVLRFSSDGALDAIDSVNDQLLHTVNFSGLTGEVF